jgi:4-hydroxy-4-methyl-2-oxoglutarate aldolase
MERVGAVEAVAPAAIDWLRTVRSAALADALAELGYGNPAIGPAVRCLFPEQPPLVAQALTVSLTNAHGTTSDYWEGFWAVFDALARMPAPSAIVAGDRSGRPSRFACSGDVVAVLGQRLGCVGYVTDASVRDLHQVEPLGFAFFASGVCVSHADFRYEDVGGDVTLAGQPVRTGDLLHGDADGVLVVPREALGALPEAVGRVRERREEELRRGERDRG